MRPQGAELGPEVIIHDDGHVDCPLTHFRKKCERAGIPADLRMHRHHEKPSERRKRELAAAARKDRRFRYHG